MNPDGFYLFSFGSFRKQAFFGPLSKINEAVSKVFLPPRPDAAVRTPLLKKEGKYIDL
jgi:hypothetical protein